MVAVTELLALALVAFAGGAIGAAVGGLPAFSFAGVVIVVGEVAKITRGSVAVAETVDSAALGSTGITASIGLGPGFGPHVAFAGGVAAAAYAARTGDLDTGFDYHEAKNVTYALGTKPAVLFVGGVFGVVGLTLTRGAVAVGVPADPIALSIVLSAFLHRIAFGYPLVGRIRGGVLDMTPYERRERRPARADGGVDARVDGGSIDEGSGAAASGSVDVDLAATDTRRADPDSGVTPEGSSASRTRYVVEPWLPHQYRWANIAFLGAVVGIFSAFVTYRTGSPFLAFGITAASLIFLNLGMERMPITHHMALPAGILVVALVGAADPALVDGGVTPEQIEGAVTLPFALVAGAVIGLLAGLFGELSQRVLYAHADTHLDPPAAAIVLATFLVGILEVAGVVSTGILPLP